MILLIGYFGYQNAGDEFLYEKGRAFIKACFPDYLICKGTKKSLIFQFFNATMIVFPGGGLLQNATSNRSLLYYLSIILLATICQKKVILLSQGIGPIRGRFMSRLTQKIVALSQFVSVRDAASYQFLKEAIPHVHLSYDLAFYDPAPPLQKEPGVHRIGVNVRPSTALNFYREALLSWADSLSNGVDVIAQNGVDVRVCRCSEPVLLMDLFNKKYISTPVSFMVSMRLHGCIWAILNEVPCLALVYDEKVYQLAKQFGIPYIDLRRHDEVDLFKYLNHQISHPVESEYDRSKLKTHFEAMKQHVMNLRKEWYGEHD